MTNTVQAWRLALSAMIIGMVALTGSAHDSLEELCTFVFQISPSISLSQIAGIAWSEDDSGGVGGEQRRDQVRFYLRSTSDCRVSTSILLMEPGQVDRPAYPSGVGLLAMYCGSVLCEERVVHASSPGALYLLPLRIDPLYDAIVLQTVTID